MMRRFIYSIISFIVLGFGLQVNMALAVDETLIDTQDAAVATNLGLFGGQPLDITSDPTDGNVVYAATYTPNGIFFSNNGGADWSTLPTTVDYGAGKDVVIDATTGTAYALIGDEVITTDDHGETWTALTDNLAGHPIIGGAGLYANDTLLVGADSGTVQVSHDDGATFTSVAIQAGTTSAEIKSFAAGSTGIFYAAILDNSTDVSTLYRSTDSGDTWSAMDVEASGVAAGSLFYGVSVDPDDANHLVLPSYHPDYSSYHSLDAGTTWLPLDNGTTRIGSTQAVFDGNERLYIGIYYTENPGAASPTWSEIETTTPLSSVRGNIYGVDYTNPLTIYSDTGLGIAKSEDGGLNWIDIVDGMTALQTFDIAQANDKAVVWIGANGGLAKSINFTSATPDWEFPILPDSSISSVQAVWVKPGDGDYVLAGSFGFISLSTDGGTTWASATTPSFFGTVEEIIQSPTDNQTLYAVYTNTSLSEDDDHGGVFMSTDTGATWTDLDFPSTLAGVALAVAADGDSDVLYVGAGFGGSETGVYKYDGTTWEKLEEDFGGLYVNNILVHPDDNDTVFVSLEAASTLGGLYRSTNGGDTFKELTNGLENANHLGAMTVQPGSNTIYLAGQAQGNSGMIYKSSDNGDTWNNYYVGLKQEFFYALLFDGLLSANDRGLYSLQSLGKLKVKASHVQQRETLRITLKDAATLDLLAERRLKVYKKRKGHAWRLVDSVTTNENGKVIVKFPAVKTNKFKVVWRPNKADRDEYAKTISRIVTVK